MLHHGANPSYSEAIYGADPGPDGSNGNFQVSTRVFRALLAFPCCESTPLADCSCHKATVCRPKLKELAELVKQKKLEKRLGLYALNPLVRFCRRSKDRWPAERILKSR